MIMMLLLMMIRTQKQKQEEEENQEQEDVDEEQDKDGAEDEEASTRGHKSRRGRTVASKRNPILVPPLCTHCCCDNGVAFVGGVGCPPRACWYYTRATLVPQWCDTDTTPVLRWRYTGAAMVLTVPMRFWDCTGLQWLCTGTVLLH